MASMSDYLYQKQKERIEKRKAAEKERKEKMEKYLQESEDALQRLIDLYPEMFIFNKKSSENNKE